MDEMNEFSKYDDYSLETPEDVMKLWDRFVEEENIINSEKIRGWLFNVVNELVRKGDSEDE